MRNGLFLISIGLLVLMYSLNQNTLSYDYLSLVTAFFLLITGGVLAFKAHKKEKLRKGES